MKIHMKIDSEKWLFGEKVRIKDKIIDIKVSGCLETEKGLVIV